MTDKVQKVREEVVRMHNLLPVTDGDNISVNYADRICTTLEMYIDSLQEEPISEELEEAATKYGTDEFPSLCNGCKHVPIDAFEAGAKWQKEQMMKNATDVTVHIDAGSYPYIPQIELYDYDKDVPLAKKGDKYKVVLIKEE